MQPQKWQNDLGLFLRKTIPHYSNANLCLNHWSQRSCNWLVLWKPTRSSITNTKKRLDHRRLECKRKKSRNIHNRQVCACPWSTKWSRAMANIVLSREHTSHSKHPFPTTQEMTLHMDIADGQYQNQIDYVKVEKLYIFSKSKTWSWLLLRLWTPYCKIQASIEESRKTTRSFSYDLNQIPCDHTVVVTNRFKGLDMVDRVPEQLCTEVCNMYKRERPKPSQKERKARRQSDCLRKFYK